MLQNLLNYIVAKEILDNNVKVRYNLFEDHISELIFNYVFVIKHFQVVRSTSRITFWEIEIFWLVMLNVIQLLLNEPASKLIYR